MPDSWHGRHGAKLRAACWIVIVASLVAVARAFPLAEGLDALQTRIDAMGLWGPVAICAIYVAVTILILPGSAVTLAIGALFGLWLGSVIVSVGATVGAAIAFLIARHGARARVQRMIQGRPLLMAIDAAIGEGGWRIVGLLRLSHFVPFALSNYFYGLTPVPFWPYVGITWLAMLPGTVMYVYYGQAGRDAISGNGGLAPLEWGVLGAGAAVTLAVSVYAARLLKRALARQATLRGDSCPASPEEIVLAPPPSPRKTAALALTALALAAFAAIALADPHVFDGVFGFSAP